MRLSQWHDYNPKDLGSLHHLRYLALEGLRGKETPHDLAEIGNLTELRMLSIYRSMPVWLRGGVIPAPEVRLVIGSDHPFRSLAEFEFLGLRSWLVFAQGVMPKLQRLKLDCDLNVMKRNGGWLDVGLENLTSLERISITAYPDLEVEEAKTMIRDVIDIHPNHPTLELVQPSTYQDRFK
ncbi:hypothetical protein PR202_gb03422 [Eleusine coracana subsp. coracana]|uniref:Disease resistance R13L4/SHOC-2-like LRR domain-containing protein n=1 Tax=Eleusine coracana subsp. coracana TaxID=191504 RepID=A0AAV5E0A6_ELECO|nr:hypothetical protein PR202_gb03422 [Eleusine coracana subsp. coracana]